jgi:photosystem II stability/assembly factor-like uncharacterized protein
MAGIVSTRSRVCWAAPLALAIVAPTVTGCGASGVTSTRRTSAPKVASRVATQPQSVAGHRLGDGGYRAIKLGTRVPSGRLAARVFANARRGFALFNSSSGETFPAATDDGGRIWRIDGPVFFAPAADGALAVDQTGAVAPGTYWAFGPGSVVDVTTDGGKRWWQAALGDEVPAVVSAGGHLVAFAQEQIPTRGETLHAVTWVYRSTNGGRSWRAYSLLALP